MVLRQYHNNRLREVSQYMKRYNIGLDIGTTSVGWAVTDANKHTVIRKGNKALWGVRLFEEANTAVTTRLARGNRRRFDRRRKRIKLLQELLKEEIEKVDSNFFQRMKESFYSKHDTINKTIKLTKRDKDNIKKYYQKFPTIYHLRNELVNNPEKMDIRLVYLALHHIIKYRGNFLYAGDFKIESLDIEEKIQEIFGELRDYSENIEFVNLEFLDTMKLKEILMISSKQDKVKAIKEELTNIVPKEFISEFQKAIVGNIFSVTKMFKLETEEEIKTNYKGSSFEDNLDTIEKLVGNNIEVLISIKELYDMLFLSSLFKRKGNHSISELMIERYEKHQKDLRFLKELLKENRDQYIKMFKTSKNAKEACIYDQYIHNKITLDDLQRTLKKILESLFGEETYIEKYHFIIENEEFLPRITDSDNGKYPYQLNKEELIKIIQNQGKYYSSLLEKVEEKDFSEKEENRYKIVKLLSFRIPYYVGPLNDSTSQTCIKNKNAWLTYHKGYHANNITPYNFNQAIDIEKSAESFIKRMISHCTYLLQEKAMPTNSILYSKFKVLNELKQISVNNYRLEDKFQQKIYQELFLKQENITEKKFIDYLRRQPEMSMYDDFLIQGYSADKKFANNMKSYIDFFSENGIFKETFYTIEDAESIIEWITIFEDKEILEKKLKQEYPRLSENQLKRCLGLRYKGWSSLSKKLLTEIKNKDGKSIMELMEEVNPLPEKKNQNFLQILNDKDYQFQQKIDQENHIDSTRKINYQLVSDLTTSPANKRGIFQALKVVEEIVDYMGYEPQSITIEMARGSDKKKRRKDNRKQQLQKIYENCKKDIENYKKLCSELAEQEKLTEKLFLYFIQEGKSLYSGKPIDIEVLEECEVDHIIPRTLIKDDSLDNKALVFRNENQKKAASFTIPIEYRTSERITWWNRLLKNGLISRKKFNSLKRAEYSDKDIEGFINRQLVETRQITKHIANILQNYYSDSKIIYLNANLSYNYREKFELFKFRELNDYHHAHDAYLAAVLGAYQNYIFKGSINIDEVKEQTRKLYEDRNYKELGYGIIINSINNCYLKYDGKTGEVKTDFDADKFNEIIENTLYRNDILISKKTELRTGEFYNQTKNKKGGKGVSLKKGLPTDFYGAYTSLNPSYAMMIRYTKKGKDCQKLIGMPIYYDKQSQKDKTEYIRNVLNIDKSDSITIIKDKIPFYSTLNWNNQVCMLVGATDKVEVCNAKEFQVEKRNAIEWKYTLYRLLHHKKELIDDMKYDEQLGEIIKYMIDKIEKEYVLYQNLVNDMKKFFCYDNLNDLTIELKEKIIIEMLKLLKTNSETANLKFLDSTYSMAFGKKHGKTVENCQIINKSVTGIYEDSYEL